MRVLMIGSRHPWRMERAVERALRRAGHTTLLLDDRRLRRQIGTALTQRWVLARAKRFDADFVFLSKCLGLRLETVSRLVEDRQNAMWYHDPQWYNDLERPDIAHIAAVGKLARTFFVTGFDVQWRLNGLNALFLPAAGDAGIAPVEFDGRFASDVAFVGTGYDPARAELLLKLARDFDVRVWGLGWQPWKGQLRWSGRPVEGRDFARVCSSSKIVLGINPSRASAATNYTSDRTWMVLLAGGFLLAPGTPGMKAMLRGGEHCAWYDDTQSCVEQIRRFLADDSARRRIAEQGAAFARRYHTYDRRIENLLRGAEFVNPLQQ